MQRLSILLAAVVLGGSIAYSQTASRPFNLGFFLNGNINFLTTNLRWSSDYPASGQTSPTYTHGGFGGGGIVNIPLTSSIFLTGRLGFQANSGKLDFYFYDPRQDGFYAKSDRVIDLSYNYIDGLVGVQAYDLIPSERNFYLLGGIELGGFTSIPYRYSFIGPDGIPREGQGDMASQSKTRVALTLGAGYTFELSPNVFLSPELSLRLPLTKVIDSTRTIDIPVGDPPIPVITTEQYTYSFPQLRLGISLTFGITPAPAPTPAPEERRDIVAFESVRTYDDRGNPMPVETLEVVETKYQEQFPVIPYVFFQQNSSEPVPGTQTLYRDPQEAARFDPSTLPMDPVEINRHTLNIVGQRMKASPKSQLTVTGTTDGTQLELSNKNLPADRAAFVKNYLTTVWGISPQRIVTRTALTPTKPSNPNDPDGVAENRRAELTSTDPALFEPIILDADRERLANPQVVEFVPKAVTADSIVYWEISIYQEGKLLRRTSGTGTPRTLQWVILPNELADRAAPIEYRLEAQLSSGKRLSDRGTLPVRYISQERKRVENYPDKTIAKFSLSLFDFDKAEVSAADQEIIRKYIIPMIKPNSTVKIYGYTDRIGSEDYNLRLATQRADAVKSAIQKALRERRMKEVPIEAYGVGERVLLFDNDSPVGRHLSRTVQVYVITPK